MSGKIHELRLDKSSPLAKQPTKGHNRWHPAIPPLVEAEPGDELIVDTIDALDCQITSESSVADASGWNLGLAHPLSGPIRIKGAEEGDLLEIEVVDIEPDEFGWTAQLPGFGFLRDLFDQPYLIRWQISGGYAQSSDLPGVRIPGAPFPGVIGVAPSASQLDRITERERAAAERGAIVLPPDPNGAIPAFEPFASQGLRTIPPRETGGNVDIKQLTKGTRVYLPVWTAGALFSIGDAHFAQGDGEVCGTAIEMAATFHLKIGLQKGAAREHGVSGLQFQGEMALQPPRRYYATTGLSMRDEQTQESENVTLAARNALIAMITYLQGRGFSRQQAYAICSLAVDLRISEVVDVPNFLVSAFLPLDIFTS